MTRSLVVTLVIAPVPGDEGMIAAVATHADTGLSAGAQAHAEIITEHPVPNFMGLARSALRELFTQLETQGRLTT